MNIGNYQEPVPGTLTVEPSDFNNNSKYNSLKQADFKNLHCQVFYFLCCIMLYDCGIYDII